MRLKSQPLDMRDPATRLKGYEPGDWWWSDHLPGSYDEAPRCPYWDNCEGRFVWLVLPDGTLWNSHWRASNCTMKEDRKHRCWVLHGEWPNVTADKNGLTCQAGAGSIVGHSGFHGFLHNGDLA